MLAATPLHTPAPAEQVPNVGDTGLVTTDRQYCHSFHHLLLLDNLLTTMLLYSMSPSAASIHLSARCTRPWPGLATNHCTGPGSSFQSRGQVGAPIFGSWCCPRRWETDSGSETPGTSASTQLPVMSCHSLVSSLLHWWPHNPMVAAGCWPKSSFHHNLIQPRAVCKNSTIK